MPVTLGKKVIEDGFPSGLVSQLAEHESWRKEIYRPIYYIHKWWARRLGSVFRSIIIASCVDEDQDISKLLWSSVEFPNVVVFDPFMGSGTTIGEAVKLGCRVIGMDINPVSLTMVRAALQNYSEAEVDATFDQISATVGEKIRSLYTQNLPSGEQAEVLYYFWVKIVPCLLCGFHVDLFKSRIFAKHATPSKHPEAKAICPKCHSINDVKQDASITTCQVCDATYNPRLGNLNQSRVRCSVCQSNFTVIDAVRRMETPLQHRMYAKLVLLRDGRKVFLPADENDNESYQLAETMLASLWNNIPDIQIQPGYNTNQVLNYNYKYWHQMFNARQLVSLGLLASTISKIQPPELRALFACLFSSTLEFNNMFASFKGLGTGAVRHMFAHHVLKPELTPLEANVWGTSKSSGSFSTLFKSKIKSALDYKSRPFELKVSESKAGVVKQVEKVFNVSKPINKDIISNYEAFKLGDGVYLSCRDSASTDIDPESVDLVITDPPFFDNVHYSELADFFYVWLRKIIGEHGIMSPTTTRANQEVQSAKEDEFSNRLADVLSECHRVLRGDGLLVFTYHHSRIEGWSSLYKAVRRTGFTMVRSHPVKSEMAVSVAIQQAKTPISYDLIMVCKKVESNTAQPEEDSLSISACLDEAKRSVQTLREASMNISLGDSKVILMGCILTQLSTLGNLHRELKLLQQWEHEIDSLAKQIL